MQNLSIRTILGLIIGFMGGLALLLALLSGEVLQGNAYNNLRLSMQKLVGLKADDLLADLVHKSADLGASLQKGKDFQQAYSARDVARLQQLMDIQFHAFYVTSGLMKLEALYTLSPELNAVSSLNGDSSGFDLFSDACAPLLRRARNRTGAERMQLLSGLCLQGGRPFQVVIQPMGGLRLTGYVAVVTDPAHNLQQIETALGMPLSIRLPDHTAIFQSREWPAQEAIADIILAEYLLKTDDSTPVLSLMVVDDLRPFYGHLPQTRLVVMSAAILITIMSMLLVMWVLRRTTLRPLQALSRHLGMVRGNRMLLGQPVGVSGIKEIQDLARSFNDMSSELAKANLELQQEVATRKQAEADLLAHRYELEKLVEIRTKDLEEARDAALQASQTKSAFIANVSHEIRTPLTPIIGFAESILQDNPDVETRNSLLHAIIRNGRHLFNVINEILDLSKIEADKLEIEKVDVNISQLFHDIESVIGTMAREKGLLFEMGFSGPVPRHIYSDPTRIRQILMNLLSNAIKFTDEGYIGLNLKYDPDNRLLHFTVSDTGIGIPQDKQDRLFKSFSQTDSSTTRRYGGTGLGLYISQRLAQLLGGDISMKSVAGVWTRFDVIIAAEGGNLDDLISTPDALVPLSYASTGLPASIPQLCGRILLAEDTPDNQRLISHYIGKTGASVTVAGNGQIAVEMAMADDYDLILMDMQMPVMGGEEAVEILRACGCLTPIVALTANAMKGDWEKYASIGCEGVLGKPIRQPVFYQILARYLPEFAGVRAGDAGTIAVTQDKEFLELQAGFQESLTGYVASLREAMAQENYQLVLEQGHILKGMGGSFGFPEITLHAATLETAMKSARYSLAAELCVKLCEVLEKAAVHPLHKT
jgi:signal transduction histidine kinase/DNA-binding response OmpR family regulator